MGVQRIRVICTTDTPSWVANAPDSSFDWDEFQQLALDTSAWYATTGLAAELNFWQTVTIKPRSHSYVLDRVRCNTRANACALPLCNQFNGMVSVGANGQVYPCLQCSGTFEAWGYSLGNALQQGMLELMREGACYDVAHARVAKKLSDQSKCAGCPWFSRCAGDCPALSFLHSHRNFFACDPTACLFFEGGWHERFAQALEGWTCAAPMV